MSKRKTKKKLVVPERTEAGRKAFVYRALHLDGARATNDFKTAWGGADSRSINASFDPTTRQTIRNRARQCVANQAFAYGAASILSQLVVGAKSPRLQLSFKDGATTDDVKNASFIEGEFEEFCERTELLRKLKALRFSRFVDGESFAVIHADKTVASKEVQLNISTIDAVRVTSFGGSEKWAIDNPYNEDGILYNHYGAPILYRVLNCNPGDAFTSSYSATEYDASSIVHYYSQTFTEQRRGISELAPVIVLLSQLDSFSKSVVKSANIASDLAVLFKTPGQDLSLEDPLAPLDFERGTGFLVPDGCDITQLKAEQPTSTYSMFVEELLTQICTGLQIPKALFSASNYNFSSAKLDLCKFEARIKYERQELESIVLRRLFNAWFKEFSLLYGVPRPNVYTPSFMFTNAIGGSLDELKEANAVKARLESGVSTFSEEYGRRGLDWEQAVEQRFKEAAKLKELEKKYKVNPFEKI